MSEAHDYDDLDEDDGLDENGNFPFECAAYWTGSDWHCPLAGSEECDWECTDPPWSEGEDEDAKDAPAVRGER